ncbi:phytanoyl-CoA dioxygenase family protein [uncultured Devosia sp.]|uniref:phytanoyl-CoA dioxygenase family protein n=1 Tax=uncultured Devosia sp. TaxID=211434 RepID=UPI0035CB42A5
MSEFDLQDFLFDLRGYLILEKAIDQTLLAELNGAFDTFPDLQFGEWWGNTQRLDNNGHAGLELQNVVEAGKPFETLIDHPSWVDRLQRYCGEDGSWVEGLYIDECFASVRRSGGYFPLHSGGQDGVIRNQYGFANGKFHCGQVNILLALTDIGPGDGGTRIVPGSHKSNIAHPVFSQPFAERVKAEDEVVEGSIEVNMKAGDALMFVDALSHGATKRTNAGDRRVVIYRYGPIWGNTRYGYDYSPELLARVTPAQRKILQPITRRAPGTARGLDRHAAE